MDTVLNSPTTSFPNNDFSFEFSCDDDVNLGQSNHMASLDLDLSGSNSHGSSHDCFGGQKLQEHDISDAAAGLTNTDLDVNLQQWIDSIALPPVSHDSNATEEASASSQNTEDSHSNNNNKKEHEVDSTCSASCSSASDSDSDFSSSKAKKGHSSKTAAKKSSSASKSNKSSKKTSKKRKRGQTEDDKIKKRREANRLSAAASRERKKRYLKDLEKKVKEMEDERVSLMQNMTVTQMENARLRSLVERLAKAAAASGPSSTHDASLPQNNNSALVQQITSEEPSLKRRKICTEVSIPTASPIARQHSTTDSCDDFLKDDSDFQMQKIDLPEENPFNVSFWDKVPSGKAMLFVMIFCIALFVGIGGSGGGSDLFYGGHSLNHRHGGNPSSMRIGRRILSQCLNPQEQRGLESLTSFPGIQNPSREMITNRISNVLSQLQKLVSSLKKDDSSLPAICTDEPIHAEF